jgi:hypothetical protein
MTEPTQTEILAMFAAALLARDTQVHELLPAAAADALLAAAKRKLHPPEDAENEEER